MRHAGIIGMGEVGLVVAEYLARNPEVALTAFCEIDADRLAQAGKLFPDTRAYRDHRDMLERERLDFVCVLSSNHVHKDHVVDCAAHGIAVFCEKPIALTAEDGYAMVAAVEQAGVFNMVNFTLRLGAGYVALKTLTDSGRLGRPLACWAHALRGYGLHAGGARHPAVQRPDLSGGWLLHHSIHQLDLLRWLGGDVSAVDCRTISTTPAQHSEELIFGLLLFASGGLGQLTDCNVARRQSCAGVVGERGTAVLSERMPMESDLSITMEDKTTETVTCTETYDRKHHKSLDSFLDALRHGRKPCADMRDGWEALRIALACRRSALEKRNILIQEIHSKGGQV